MSILIVAELLGCTLFFAIPLHISIEQSKNAHYYTHETGFTIGYSTSNWSKIAVNETTKIYAVYQQHIDLVYEISKQLLEFDNASEAFNWAYNQSSSKILLASNWFWSVNGTLYVNVGPFTREVECVIP